MKGSKRFNMSRLFLLLLLLPGLFSGAWAEDSSGDNSITVYKVTNLSGTKPGLLHSLEEPLTPDLMVERKVRGIAGSTIAVFSVPPEATREDLDKMTVASLEEKYTFRTQVTDGDGKAVFSNLPDGRYYIRDITEKDEYISMTSLVDLPFKDGQRIIKDLHVSLKVSKPEEPGRTFLKVDNSPTPVALQGARFKVYQKVNRDGKEALVPVKVQGEELIVTSDSNGRFTVTLPVGKYWLVETRSPEAKGVKYKLLSTPYAFTITENSLDEKEVTIVNVPGDNIPNRPPKTPPPKTPPKNPPPKTPPPHRPPRPKREKPPRKVTPPKPKREIPKRPPEPPTTPTTPRIRIPKTGDIQIFLMVIGGLNLFAVGAYNYHVENKKKK